MHVAFIPDRWDGGTQSMSHDVEYIYFRLCKAMWATGMGVLREDAAAECRFHPKTDAAVEKLLAIGKLAEIDGRLVNERALAEHECGVKVRDARSKGGKARAKQMWGADSSANSSANSSEEASLIGTQTQTHTHSVATLQSVGAQERDDDQHKPEPEKPKPKRSATTYIPDDWQPSQSGIDAARKRGLSEEDIACEAERFRNHYSNRTGAQFRHKNWDRTWYNWVTSHRCQPGAGGNGPRRGGPAPNPMLAALAKIGA